jgi:uncharacterized Zn-finger protein
MNRDVSNVHNLLVFLQGRLVYRCQMKDCTETYSKECQLEAHMDWHKGIKSYLCSWQQCEMQFTSSDGLRYHLITHIGERPYACVSCNKTFMRSDHLDIHTKKHSKENDDPNRPEPSEVDDKNESENNDDTQLCYNPDHYHQGPGSVW